MLHLKCTEGEYLEYREPCETYPEVAPQFLILTFIFDLFVGLVQWVEKQIVTLDKVQCHTENHF